MNNRKRIFIGLSNTAGYGSRLVKGFRKAGIKADLYIKGEHPFKYDEAYTHRLKKLSNLWLNRIYIRFFLIKCLFRYRAFIFFSGISLLKDNKDFRLYRLFKKKNMIRWIQLKPEKQHYISNGKTRISPFLSLYFYLL